jgi:hypothetical protein
MKKLILSAFAFGLLSFGSFAQAPEQFNYQAVLRDAGNLVLNNQAVGMQMTILQGSPTGTAVYQETFTTTTNTYGLINLQIGSGTVVSGDFALIDWSNGPYFVETAVDNAGGTNYSVMGTSQLMSVPYALHANSAETVLNDQVDDADADPTNEIQDLELNGNILTITNNGAATSIDLSQYLDHTDTQLTEAEVDAFVANNGFITSPNDADADPTNEIQDLELNGNILTITNNGAATSIDLSQYLDNTDTQLTEAEVDAFVANNGFITSPNDADADPTNEIQDLELNGNILTITNNGTATSIDLSQYLDNTDTQLTEAEVDAFVANNGFITSPNDADADPNNEIQTISRSGTTVSLSNGGGTFQDSIGVYTAGSGIDITNNEVSEAQYQIGDYAYGGIVFYVDESGEHGLVIAMNDVPSSPLPWSPGTSARSMADALGLYGGIRNTTLIIAAQGYGNGSNYAAYACSFFKTTNEAPNWYLPSLYELQYWIYPQLSTVNAALVSNGGVAIGTGNYWSSNQVGADPTQSHSFNFVTNNWSYNLNSQPLSVRAIKPF